MRAGETPLVISVLLWRLETEPARLDTLADTMSPDEAERAARFVSSQARNAFVAARGRVRQLLARHLSASPRELRFHYGPEGKPALDGGPPFNVSHSGGLAALAIASGDGASGVEIGIDIERERQVSRGLAQRYFSTAENAELDAMGDAWPSGFFRGWSRKEAVLKALGCGLSRDPRGFTVPLGEAASLAPLGTLEIEDRGAARKLALFDLAPHAGFAGAVALTLPGEAPRLDLRWVDAS